MQVIKHFGSLAQSTSSELFTNSVLERVEGLLALAGGMQQSIRQEFTLKLMQLPKQVFALRRLVGVT